MKFPKDGICLGATGISLPDLKASTTSGADDSLFQRISQTFQRVVLANLWTQRRRRLQVTESLPLGDKRFLHIVKIDSTEYLIGGGSATITLLARLGQDGANADFRQNIHEAWQEGSIL